jgi:hypothetical protein
MFVSRGSAHSHAPRRGGDEKALGCISPEDTPDVSRALEMWSRARFTDPSSGLSYCSASSVS